jgi:sugar lactone lactonase YvrE
MFISFFLVLFLIVFTFCCGETLDLSYERNSDSGLLKTSDPERVHVRPPLTATYRSYTAAKGITTTVAIDQLQLSNHLSIQSSSIAGIITTVAGTGTSGYSGDGGQATSANLNTPNDIALDSSGNIYIADVSNSVIRKVTVSTGYISTVAGTGTSGYSGDGGQATSATMKFPYGVALDSSGNIYVADNTGNCIRKVTVSTGIITTVAGTGSAGYNGDGGQATLATLNQVQGVFVDASGNIYIPDYASQRIRKVTVSTGIITTVAGTGSQGYSGDGGQATSAMINYPQGVFVDTSGNIYIPDNLNFRIRKVTISTGYISTVAGTGTQGYSGDGGQATSATLNYPYSVVLDASGNIYIADKANYRIRVVTVSTGIITTLAGTGSSGYSGAGGQATSATFNEPKGITIDASANIYVADNNNNRIRVFSQYSTPTSRKCRFMNFIFC